MKQEGLVQAVGRAYERLEGKALFAEVHNLPAAPRAVVKLGRPLTLRPR